MSFVASICLVVATATAPLAVEAARERDMLRISFRLLAPLPAAIENALPSGAVVRVRYPIRLRSDRKLWWDRKVWKGEVISLVVFDPVTGRYRGDVVLDGVIVTSREMDTAADAREFLIQPGPVLLALPPKRRAPSMKVRVRAVFASSTQWLFFPDIEGTSWVEVPLQQAPAHDSRSPTAVEPAA